MTASPSTPIPVIAEAGEREARDKLKRQYPDYIDDPEGLERFRRDVLTTPGHDMASVNHNSLGRLIDTIDRLRAERDAALSTPATLDNTAVEGLVKAATLTVLDAAYHLKKYRPHCLEALEAALRSIDETTLTAKTEKAE